MKQAEGIICPCPFLTAWKRSVWRLLVVELAVES